MIAKIIISILAIVFALMTFIGSLYVALLMFKYPATIGMFGIAVIFTVLFLEFVQGFWEIFNEVWENHKQRNDK